VQAEQIFNSVIDDLASKGTITDTLKQFAHEVRFTGNVGAHSDGLGDVKESDAEDIMAFTFQYLEHVYVMPAVLEDRRRQTATKKGAAKP
jgi:hypothetical protein